MNKKIKYIIGLLFSTLILFTSCGENEYLYDSVNPETMDAASTVLLGAPNQTIVVDPEVAATNFTISASVWGKLPSADVTIPFVIDSTELPDAAIVVNGSGFTIPAGSNTGAISIDLIADEITPGVIYYIYYHLGTPSDANFGINDLASSGVITLFNPGPLAPWVGDYTGTAVSQHRPGVWDEEWSCSIALDPADPLNNVLIYGIAGSNVGLVGTIDIIAETITIVEDQNIGDVYGYGDSYIYYGEAPWTYLGGDLVGTVDLDGTIVVTGMLITTGPYMWDIFDVTFSKSAKKSTEVKKVNKVPTNLF